MPHPCHEVAGWFHRRYCCTLCNLGTRWRWVGQLHTSPTLPMGKNFFPLNRRLGGCQRWSGYFREEKNVLLLLGFETWSSISGVVTMFTALPCFWYIWCTQYFWLWLCTLGGDLYFVWLDIYENEKHNTKYVSLKTFRHRTGGQLVVEMSIISNITQSST